MLVGVSDVAVTVGFGVDEGTINVNFESTSRTGVCQEFKGELAWEICLDKTLYGLRLRQVSSASAVVDDNSVR